MFFLQTCNNAVIDFVQTNLLIVAVLGIVLIVAEVSCVCVCVCVCGWCVCVCVVDDMCVGVGVK